MRIVLRSAACRQSIFFGGRAALHYLGAYRLQRFSATQYDRIKLRPQSKRADEKRAGLVVDSSTLGKNDCWQTLHLANS
jgi:hypothetical protein